MIGMPQFGNRDDVDGGHRNKHCRERESRAFCVQADCRTVLRRAAVENFPVAGARDTCPERAAGTMVPAYE